MRQLTLATLRSHAARYVAGALAIVLGVAFVTAALLVLGSARTAMTQAVGTQYTRADLVVFDEAPIKQDVVRRIAALESVDGVSGIAMTGLPVTYPGATQSTWAGVSTLPADPDLRWHKLKEGRLPRAAGEVAVSELIAADRDLRPGMTLHADGPDDTTNALKIVGIVSRGSLLQHVAFVATEDWLAHWRGTTHPEYDEILVRAAPGTDLAELKDRVRGTAGTDAVVRTVDEHVDEVVQGLTGGINVLGAFLLGFAAIAVFVATLVVANTFTILLAQRTRELALLRCVGAQRGQVRRSVLGESTILGLVASAVGVAVGTGLAAVAVVLLGQTGAVTETVQLHPIAMLVPVAVGLLTTVVAALVPARRATRVPPLAALRPELAVRVRSRGGVLRLGLAILLVLGGVGLLAVGLQASDIVVGMLFGVVGGAISFLGVIVGARFLVPLMVRLIGVLARRLGGVPGRLSVANAIRNPGRTAATATALLVGVTLISLMSVGAASVERTIHASLDDQYPLDISAETVDSAGIPSQAVEAVRDIEGVESLTTLSKASVETGPADGPTELIAYGLDPKAASSVLRDTGPVRGLRDGVAVLSPSVASSLDVEEGDQLRLRGEDDTAVTVQVRVIRAESTPPVLVTARDLARLVPDAPSVLIWARVADDAAEQNVISRVEEALAGIEGTHLGGGAPERAFYNQVLTVMLLVATGLLGVAVLIALVGVGNTLSLSVIERTREQALLRALGVTRGQLRGMLAIEALLIAGAAVVLGTLLGIGYGFAGTTVLLDLATDHVQYTVPVGRLLVVAAVALVAGLVASVLPARRAVRVPPAAALTDE